MGNNTIIIAMVYKTIRWYYGGNKIVKIKTIWFVSAIDTGRM